MTFTNKVPVVPLEQFKRTKIIATVGPSSDSYKSIYDMVVAGANGLRLNFSHGTQEERLQQIEWIRRASKSYGKPVAIIQDLQGPKIRLGDFDGIINVRAGQTIPQITELSYVDPAVLTVVDQGVPGSIVLGLIPCLNLPFQRTPYLRQSGPRA